MIKEKGTCPVCNGSLRQPVTEKERHSIKWNKTYDSETNTIGCLNCVPRGMFASYTPTGKTTINRDGVPCTHEFVESTISNCYYRYQCKHCTDSFTIDSGD